MGTWIWAYVSKKAFVFMLWIGAFVHFNKSELWTLQCSFVEAWLFFLTASHRNRNIFPIPFAVFCIDLRVLWHVIRFFWDRCKFHPNCFYVFGHSSKRPRTQRQRQKITIDALKQFDMNAIACGVAKEVACNFVGRIEQIRREKIEKGTKMLETSLRSTIAETMKKVQGSNWKLKTI